MRNGGYSQFVTLCRCLSLQDKTPHTLPLLQMKTFLLGDSSPQISPKWVLPRGWSSSQTAPAWVLPRGVQSFRNQLLQHGSHRGSQALSANLLWQGLLSPGVCRSWQEPAPARGSPRGHSLLQASTYCGMGSLPCAAGLYLLYCGPPWLQGDNLRYHGLHHDLEGKTLCSEILSTYSPSFFTDLGVCRVVSHFISLLSNCHLTAVLFFLPLLKSVITEVLPLSLIGLALASCESILEPAGTGFIRHGGSFSQLLMEANTIAPPLQNPCHSNP